MSKALPSCSPGEHSLEPVPALNLLGLERASRMFRAMGDGARLRLLELLARRECCVTELVAALKEKFSTISQRLRILRSEGLIVRRREGTHLFYALADRHVVDLLTNALAHAQELETGVARSLSPQDDSTQEGE